MSLFEEIKRRKVFRLAIAYLVVAWLIIQVVDTVNEPLNLPDWFDTVTIVFLAIMFPIALMLSWAYDVTPQGVVRDGETQEAVRIDYGKIALAAVLILGAFLAGNLITGGSPDRAAGPADRGLERWRFPVTHPSGFGREPWLPLAISPDGRTVVIGAMMADEGYLWSRTLADPEWTRIDGTYNTNINFAFSPDGQQLVFQDWIDNTVKRVAVRGGTPVTLADFDSGPPILSFTWGRNGDIVYAIINDPAIYRLPDTGGTPEVVAKPESNDYYNHPRFVPDTDILMVSVGTHGQTPRNSNRLAFLDLDGNLRITDVEGSSPTPVSDDMLIYYHRNALWATAMDLETYSISRSVTPLAEDIYYQRNAYFDASIEGTLIYQPDHRLEDNLVVEVDRDGNETVIPFAPGNYSAPVLSNDGSRIAVIRRDPYDPDIFIHSADGRELFRLTLESSLEQFPIWSPNDRTLCFAQGQRDNVFCSDVRAGASATKITDDNLKNEPASISSDGAKLFFHRGNENTTHQNLAVYDFTDNQVRALTDTPWRDTHPAISPDDNWIAYLSTRSGVAETWIRPNNLEINAEARLISEGGGGHPTWGRDESELFFWNSDESMIMRAQFDVESGHELLSIEPLFSAQNYRRTGIGYYSRTADKFLFGKFLIDREKAPLEMVMIQNWPALLPQTD